MGICRAQERRLRFIARLAVTFDYFRTRRTAIAGYLPEM